MTISLTRDTVTLALDPDLQWVDEFQWSAKQQTREYSLGGALLIDEGEKLDGRPITLQPADDSAAWMTRAQVMQAAAWADEADRTFVLTINGEEFDVIFRVDENEPGLSASPVVPFSNPGEADFYVVTFRFITV